jgi:hypothetical protein
MKKFLITALIFAAAILPAHSLSFYFDAGIGVGPAWTFYNDADFVKLVTKTGKLNEFAVELGLKLGAGPLGSLPVYVVGVLGGAGHRMSDSGNNYYQMNASLIGPGVIFYPIPAMQIAASLGFSFVGNSTSLPDPADSRLINIAKQTSKSGFAWDISVAADPGIGNHALLLGLKFFNAVNTLKQTGDEQKNLMISIFARYAFRENRR